MRERRAPAFAIDVMGANRERGNHLPFDLPLLLLESLVYGLSYGALHQVHVADHLGGEGVTEMFVELPVLEVVCLKRVIRESRVVEMGLYNIIVYRLSSGSRSVSGRAGRSPTCLAAGSPAQCPCPRRTWTRRSRSAPPGGRRTRRRPEKTAKIEN